MITEEHIDYINMFRYNVQSTYEQMLLPYPILFSWLLLYSAFTSKRNNMNYKNITNNFFMKNIYYIYTILI